MRLREDAKRRDEEDRRRKDQETADLKAQLAQVQQQLLTGGGGGGSRLEQKLEQMEAENRRVAAEYAQLKEQTLLNRIQQMEAMVRGGPSTDDIKSYLKETVEQYRAQIMVEKNLEDMVEKKLALHQGPSQTAVEMEKARNDLALGVKKLEIEEKKAANLNETLKSVAGVFGEGIGKGMSGGKPGQQEQQQPGGQNMGQPGTVCPHCGVPLLLPPNVRYGICPSCKGKIEVDAEGIPQRYIELVQQTTQVTTQQVDTQPPVTQQQQTQVPDSEQPPHVTDTKRYKHRKTEQQPTEAK